MSGMDLDLLRGMLLWLLSTALVARLPLHGRWVAVLLSVPLLVWLIPPVGPLSPGRAYPGAWLLVVLAVRDARLDGGWVWRSVLHGLVALATVVLLARWTALLAVTLPPDWAQAAAWVCGGGLILVGWQVCRLLHGGARTLDYPLWVGSLGVVVPMIPVAAI